MEFVAWAASRLHVATSFLAILGVSAVGLGAGSLVRLVGLRGKSVDERHKRLGSLVCWWVILLLLLWCGVTGVVGSAVAFAVISAQGLREYLRMVAKKAEARRMPQPWLVWAAPLTVYGLLVAGGPATHALLAPILLVLGVAAIQLPTRGAVDFQPVVGACAWGCLLIVYCLSFLAALATLPEASNPQAGTAGWLLFVVLMTEINDIFQALWGRRFGRRQITPRLSPHKTWEGFWMGAVSTTLLAFLFAPWVTPLADPLTIGPAGRRIPLPWVGVAVATLLIIAGGFLGDITMSAVKRDADVKDSGTLIPSQGGVLDRIDSLTFVAPLMYVFVWLAYGE